MKLRFYKWYNVLMASLLTMLGFSSCSSDDDDRGGTALYGVPTVTFRYTGTVSDDSGQPINGVKVVVNAIEREGGNDVQFFHLDSTFTDAQGKYVMDTDAFGNVDYELGEDRMMLTFEDADKNRDGGTYANDTVRANEMKAEKMAESSYFLHTGTYKVEVDKTLKKQQ